MSKKDLTPFFEGRELNAYEYFGAHPDEEGVWFRVYAPNAQHISVVGDFNGWDGEANPMIKDENGVFSVLVPEANVGDAYKYRIVQQSGHIMDKIDPYAFTSKFRPETDSIVASLEYDGWTDQEWMEKRNKGFDDPISIYEMHVGSWRDKNMRVEEVEGLPEQDEQSYFVHYGDIVDELIAHVKKYHFSHVEVMPLSEFPFDGSWGYQVSGFYSVTSRFGSVQELKEFVNKLHGAGIGVIMDFVPVHFVKDEYALSYFDGTPLYEYSQDHDANSQWGTSYFDLWKESVRSFLLSAANYWVKEFHFDGLRMDAISNAIFWHGNKMNGENKGATDFMKRLNFMLNEEYDGKLMLIAEDSTDFPNVCKSTFDGGLGFDYKWDLGWMNDTLKYLKRDPIYRQYHHNDITFSMAYFYSEHFILPLSHDEVVHGKATIVNKMWGTYEDKFAQARALYLYMFTHPGKKLNFMGNELGMFREWDEQKGTDWFLRQYPMHAAFETYFEDLTGIYADNEAYYYSYNPTSFQWINADDAQNNVFSFMRKGGGKVFITLLNFSTNSLDLQFGVPGGGLYHEIINSQWDKYNGCMQTSFPRAFKAVRLNRNHLPFMIQVGLPPLSGIILEGDLPAETVKPKKAALKSQA